MNSIESRKNKAYSPNPGNGNEKYLKDPFLRSASNLSRMSEVKDQYLK